MLNFSKPTSDQLTQFDKFQEYLEEHPDLYEPFSEHRTFADGTPDYNPLNVPTEAQFYRILAQTSVFAFTELHNESNAQVSPPVPTATMYFPEFIAVSLGSTCNLGWANVPPRYSSFA